MVVGGLFAGKESTMKSLRAGFVAAAAALIALASASRSEAQQPFSNIYQQPTVSPYLNLLNRSNAGLPSYQTLVRPQIEQQQQDIKQRLDIQKLQRGQKSLIANQERGLAQRGISNEIRGTGHVTVFMDYLHYYPRPGAR